MSVFLCIRHGKCPHIGNFIAGRMSGIHLNIEGITEVEHLSEYLKNIEISKVYSSPLERARETAEIICTKKNIEFEVSEALNEVDYGAWSGKTFGELSTIPLWHEFNKNKSLIRIPEGEMLVEIESRVSVFVEKIRKNNLGIVALVSHGDPIKCLIAHFAGISLDLIGRIEINTASVSVLMLDDFDAHIVCINHTGDRIKI
jgi:broad specificity phosphatase PhoE